MAKIKTNIELKRVNINLPVNIIEKVKSYAEELGINTTSAYIVLINQALEQKDMLRQMPTLVTMYSDMKSALKVIDDDLS